MAAGAANKATAARVLVVAQVPSDRPATSKTAGCVRTAQPANILSGILRMIVTIVTSHVMLMKEKFENVRASTIAYAFPLSAQRVRWATIQKAVIRVKVMQAHAQLAPSVIRARCEWIAEAYRLVRVNRARQARIKRSIPHRLRVRRVVKTIHAWLTNSRLARVEAVASACALTVLLQMLSGVVRAHT